MSTLPEPKSDPNNISKIILVTGINGYIASHIALQLLQKGYTVRGTSRSPNTPTLLLSQPAFKPYATISPSPLQNLVVPDITVPGAFDAAVKGCHAVIHVASPVTFSATSTDDLMLPAVGGVLSITKSVFNENALHSGHIVSLILTSSIAAVVDRWRFPPISDGGSENRSYTEADWNTTGESVARASETNGPFLGAAAYGASKAGSERAFWDFAATHRDELKRMGLSLSAVNPGVNTGPPVIWPDSPDKLNATLAPVWDVWSGEAKKDGELPPQIGGATYIDVRDCAALHVWCAEHPELSSGQRYLATNGKAPPQAIADIIRTEYPDAADRIILGTPGQGYVERWGWPDDEPTAKATRACEALGVSTFRAFDVSIKDTVDGFRERWPELGL